MTKEDKRIINEDIKDLQNLILVYAKKGDYAKVVECEKEIKRLKRELLK